MKYAIILVALFAMLLGIGLRSIEVINHNFVFLYDQGIDLLAARSIAVLHKPTLIGVEAGGGFAGIPGLFHGPGYHYFLAAILAVSRGNPYGVMVALWIMNIAALYLIYRISARFFGRTAGLVSVFLAAVSFDFIGMSRVIWAPNFAGVFILLYLYVLLRSGRRSPVSFSVLGFVSASMYHFEIPYAAVAVLSSALVILLVDRERRVTSYLMFVCGVIAGFSPMFLFDMRHGLTTTRGVMRFLMHPVVISSVPFNMMRNLRVILFQINGVFPPIPGLPYWFWTAALLVSGTVLVRKDDNAGRRRVMAALCMVFLAHLALFVPYRNPIYGHYLVLLSYVVVFVFGYLFMRILKLRYGWAGMILILLFSVLSSIICIRTIPVDLADYGGTAKIRGKIAAIDAVYEASGGKPFNLFIFTPPVYTYPYDYLLVWYAQKKYGYLPGGEKKGEAILLIEPDPEKPWSYKGWLETVIKTGTVISTKTLPGGFIIQKREF